MTDDKPDGLLMAAELAARRILASHGYKCEAYEHFAERDDDGDLYVAWPLCDEHDCDLPLIYADRVDTQGIVRQAEDITPGHTDMQDYLRAR